MANKHMKREMHTEIAVSYTFFPWLPEQHRSLNFLLLLQLLLLHFLLVLSWALNLGEPRHCLWCYFILRLHPFSWSLIQPQILSLSLWVTAFLSAYSSGYFKIFFKKTLQFIHCLKNLSCLCVWWRKRFQGFVCMYAYVHTWHYFCRCKHIYG